MGEFVKNQKILLIGLFFVVFGIFFGIEAKAARCSDFSGTNFLTCNNANVPDKYCQWNEEKKECKDCDKKLQTDWPVSPVGTRLTGCSNLTILVKYFYEWGITLGGLAAFIALIIAGFLYLTSVGDPARMGEAKDRIKSAFFGLVLLLGSWLILNTINPQLTTLPPIDWRHAFTACGKDADCGTLGRVCKDEKDGDCYKCDIRPGEKEGLCYYVPEMKDVTEEATAKGCVGVKIYTGEDFSEFLTDINLGKKKELCKPYDISSEATYSSHGIAATGDNRQ